MKKTCTFTVVMDIKDHPCPQLVAEKFLEYIKNTPDVDPFMSTLLYDGRVFTWADTADGHMVEFERTTRIVEKS